MFSKEIFPSRLKALRCSHSLTQEQLGKAVGLTKQGINNIESGIRGTALDKVCAIADYFNVSIDYLLGRSDDPTMR